MKTILSSETMEIPDGIEITVKAKMIEVKGPRGTLTRNFKHLNLDFMLITDEETGKRKLKVDAWFGSRKTTASIRTALSHISNLIIGVTQGFRNKMRFVYAHFPINACITNNNTAIEIRNFLGEKKVTPAHRPIPSTPATLSLKPSTVSHRTTDISALNCRMTTDSTSPPPPHVDVDDKTILSSAMNRLSLDHHLDLYTLNESKVDDYMHLQPKITAKSRANVIDFLIKVHNVFNLTNETLYLTINIIDRFLAVETIPFSELQCVGVAAMHIASKYIENRESDDVIEVHEFVGLCCGAYEHQYILAMELRILVRLKWKLSVLTPCFFLTCFIKAAQEYPLETTMENMVYFYAELGLMNYETIRFCPSMVAAAAVYAARAALNKTHVWHKTLEKQTGFMEMQVLVCAKMMVEFHLVAKDDKERTEIYKKYSSEKRDAVALYPPAKSMLADAVIQSLV